MVLYTLLSGLPPFWGDTEEEIFKMILIADLDLDSEVCCDRGYCPPALPLLSMPPTGATQLHSVCGLVPGDHR